MSCKDGMLGDGAARNAAAPAEDAIGTAAGVSASGEAVEGACERAAVDVQDALRAYYRAQRVPGDQAARRAVVQAALDEARRLQADGEAVFSGRARVCFDMRRAAETLSFVACQARFMGARSWVMQAAVVIAAAFLAVASGAHAVSGLYACLAAAAIAVCGLPQATASRLYGVVELERSCKHDARSVAAARMAVLACANALGIALIAASVSYAHADTSLVFSLVCAFAPYCLTAAGCLVAVRRMGGAGALAAAAAWGAVVVGAAYFAVSYMPWLYEQAALWVWALVAAASSAWMLVEARLWLADAAHSARALSFDSSYVNR